MKSFFSNSLKANFLIMFLSIPISIYSQATGIRFTQDTLVSTLLEKGRASNKLIFINCYDTICGACKQMDKKVYPDKEVGFFFNRNFINGKIDMLKPEGTKIIMKYKVEALPTFLFLNSKGELVMKAKGILDSKNFIRLGQTALNPKLFK